jgi:hypothetical protein
MSCSPVHHGRLSPAICANSRRAVARIPAERPSAIDLRHERPELFNQHLPQLLQCRAIQARVTGFDTAVAWGKQAFGFDS